MAGTIVTSRGHQAGGCDGACGERASRRRGVISEPIRVLSLVALSLLVCSQLSASSLGIDDSALQADKRADLSRPRRQVLIKVPGPEVEAFQRAYAKRLKNRTWAMNMINGTWARDGPLVWEEFTTPGHWTYELNNVTRIRKDLKDVTEADDVSAALFKNWEPRWMDPCDLRDPVKKEFYWIGDLQKRFSLKEWEKKVNYRVQLNSSFVIEREKLFNTALKVRRKRASPCRLDGEARRESGRREESNELAGTTSVPSRGPGRHRRHKHARDRCLRPVARASGQSRNDWVPSFPNLTKNEVYGTTERAKQVVLAVREIVSSNFLTMMVLASLDVSMPSARFFARNLSEAITNETRSLDPAWPAVSPERSAAIKRELDQWLPDWRSLVLSDDKPSIFPNITGGIYTRLMTVANISDYLQLFQVGLEQVKYDHWYTYSNPSVHEAATVLDKHLSHIGCLMQGLKHAIEGYLRAKMELMPVYDESMPLDEIDASQAVARWWLSRYRAGDLAPRERPSSSNLVIESARFRAFDRLTAAEQKRVLGKMNFFLPENRPPDHVDSDHEAELPLEGRKPRVIKFYLTRPTALWREIMPLKQRKIFNPREWAIRDQAMLSKLSPVLMSLQSLNEFQWLD